MNARTGRSGRIARRRSALAAAGRWTLVVALVGSLATAIVGCGDDDDEAVQTNPNYAAQVQQAATQPSVTAPPAGTPGGPPSGYGYPGGNAGPEAEPPATPETLSDSLALPTGEKGTSVLLIERTGPSKIGVGQPYTYQIKVTNLTTSPLAGVRVREVHAGNAFTVEQANPPAEPAPQPTNGPQQPAVQQQPGPSQHGFVWNLGQLNANETKTIQVTGIPEQPGRLTSTIDAEYSRSLSAEAEATAGEVTVTKEGPDRADLCEPFSYRYVVTNTAQGDTGTLTLTDQFPPGLVTEDGKGSVSFELGSLPKGQTRDFAVKMKPQQPGEYASRAVAKGAFGEARSRRVVTVVTAPKLAVELTGPQWEQITRPVTYQVTVRNDGDAAARDVALKFDAGNGARVLAGQDLANALSAAAQPAAPPQQSAQAGQKPGEHVQQVGTIEPGKSRTVAVTVKASQPGNVALNVSATSSCGQQPVAASAQTLVVGVPALSLDVVDAADPVAVGQTIEYRLTVANAGSAADGSVAVTAQLPEGTSFVEGGGATTVKAEGARLTFAPIPALAPQQSAQWTLKLKSDRPGERRIRVEARSAGLNGVLSQTEQTRVEEPPTGATPAPSQGTPAS